MIKSLNVRNYLGDEIKITLTEDEPDHGLLLESISGLGPVKADINTMELVTADGSLYNSGRVGERNIVLKFIFTGDIEETRHLTYKYFPQKKYVDLTIETDYRTLTTRGYVESNEPDIFSEKEKCSISLICPDPFMYSASNNLVTAAKSVKLFEFPFEADEGLYFTHEPILDSNGDNILDDKSRNIEDSKMTRIYDLKAIEFGEIIKNPEARIEYDSNVEVGVTMSFKFVGPAGDIMVYNSGSKQRMMIYLSRIGYIDGLTIEAGDRLNVNTNFGEKTALLRHDGEWHNVLYCLEEDPDWIHLVNGLNTFTYNSEYNVENIEFTVISANAYEGI